MSTRIAPLARLGAVALLPLLVAARPVSTHAAEGWSFIWTTSSKPSSQGDQTMQVRLAGSHMRVDFTKAMPGTQAGSYILIDAEKTQMTMVSPKEKTATIMPLGGMASILGAVGASGLMKVEVTDISMSSEDLGAGEPILGRATHKYNMKQSYNMTVSVMGMKRGGKTESSTDLWVTTDLPAGEQRAFEEFGRNFAQSMGAGSFGGEGMKKLSQEVQAKMPRGFPLRQVATTSQTDRGGKVTTTVTTTEVQEMKRASIDEQIFEVPAGYTVSDMSAMSDSLNATMKDAKEKCEKDKGAGNCENMTQTNTDSTRMTEAMSSKMERDKAVKSAGEDATGISAVKRIGGIFGKKKPADTTKKATTDTTRKKPPTR